MSREPIRKWWGLFALMPALAMAFMDQTILPVALPTMQRELRISDVELEWIVNAYLLSAAVLVLAIGKISDWVGHRRTFIVGMLVFVVASVLCALSVGALELIAFRSLQGVGLACMSPASAAMIATLFPPQERGRANGIYISMSSLFLILGPLIGGYLTEALSWRWIFWINLPIAAVGFALAFLFLPRSESTKVKVDFVNFFVFAISIACVIVAIMEARVWGWKDSTGLLILAALGAILLMRLEKRSAHPFLDLSLYRHAVYRAVNISVWATSFILMIGVFRAIYYQNVLDYSPVNAGLLTTFSCVPVLFISPIAGHLSDRFSPKLPIAIGYFLLIFSFVWFGFFSVPSLLFLLIALGAFGVGIPLILTPSYSSAMSSVPPTKLGIAFGTLSTVRLLGSTLGVAAIGALIEGVEHQKLSLLTQETNFTFVRGLVAKDPAAHEALSQLGPARIHEILQSLREAEIAGFAISHFILGFLLFVSFIFVFLLYHRKSSHHPPSSPAEGWD